MGHDLRGVGEADLNAKTLSAGRFARYSRRPMKKLTALAALLCTLSLTVCDADAAKKAKEQAPVTEEQKTLYALGMLMSQSLSTFDLKPEELAQVQKGLADGVGGVKGTIKAEGIHSEGAGAAARAHGGRSPRRPPPLASRSSTRRRRKPASPRPRVACVIKHTKEGTGAIAGRHRPGEGALRRPPHRRQGVRQLDRARRARDVPAERRDRVLDRRRADHEGRRQGAVHLPGESRLWRATARRRRFRRSPRSCSTWSCSRS